MAYVLREATIRANHTAEGMKRVEELWRDVSEGEIPLLFDSKGGFSRGFPRSRGTAIPKQKATMI